MEYKYFGLLAFTLLVVGLAFVVHRWPAENHLTFSQRVALQRESVLYYIGLFTLVLPILLFFIIGWFMPHFQLPVWFPVFITVSALLQYIGTLIPEVGGWKTKVHRFIYGISALSLLPPLFILLLANSVSTFDKFVVVSGLATMIGLVIFANVTKRDRYEVSYIHQSIYYAGFFIPILAISYL